MCTHTHTRRPHLGHQQHVESKVHVWRRSVLVQQRRCRCTVPRKVTGRQRAPWPQVEVYGRQARCRKRPQQWKTVCAVPAGGAPVLCVLPDSQITHHRKPESENVLQSKQRDATHEPLKHATPRNNNATQQQRNAREWVTGSHARTSLTCTAPGLRI